MSDWSVYALPPVQDDGYGYTVAANVMRTPFETPRPNQKRGDTLNIRQFNAHVLLTHTELMAAEAFTETRGFSWFSMDLISGYAEDTLLPGSYPSIHSVRMIREPRISELGKGRYRMDMMLESRPLPYNWVVVDGQTWSTATSSQYVGLRVSPVPYPTTLKAARFKTDNAAGVVYKAYMVINGVRTDLITLSQACGVDWLEIPFHNIEVPEQATLDVAMLASSTSFIADYYKNAANAKAFESLGESYPPSTFGVNAFGVDVQFRHHNPP